MPITRSLRVFSGLALTVATAMAPACQKPTPVADPELITPTGTKPLPTNVLSATGARPLNALIDDRLRLIGVKLPTTAKPGAKLPVTLWWRVEAPVTRPLKAFVHVAAAGAEMNTAQADHPLVGGAVEPSLWRVGDVLQDSFTLRVPQKPHADVLKVWVGLYSGKERWPVTAGEQDGDNRVLAGVLRVPGAPTADPVVKAVHRQGPVVIDGHLSEADWARAERVGPFISYDGKRRIQNNTWARLLWDEQNLYVAFECDDKDIHTPYKKNDDPLYNSEAVEIFIDADGDKDEYVELQAAPNNLHFDAAFKGGRRKNFDTSYNVAYETAVAVDGTLNQPGDVDKGWVSEWRIPIAQLRDVPHAPKVGDRWKINLFRLDRRRRGTKVIGSEASAWSSPLSGDFHNLDRFGTLLFSK